MRMRNRAGRASQVVGGVTIRLPILRARSIGRNRGLRLQPLVMIVQSAWSQRIQSGDNDNLDRLLAKTLYHELCHAYGYGHGRPLNRLDERFALALASPHSLHGASSADGA